MKRDAQPTVRLDALALGLAGVVNTLLAPADLNLVLDRGTVSASDDPAERAAWIAGHVERWQAGWAFWFVVTLTFAWGFVALAHHAQRARAWAELAVGMALLAAAVDIVGIVVNIAVVPEAAAGGVADNTFRAAQELGHALTDVAAFGLYSVAGLLLVASLAATPRYPRGLARLGWGAWAIAALATVLVAVDAPGTAAVATVAFVLYAPWAGCNAWWIMRGAS
jgi:hypothetical protein